MKPHIPHCLTTEVGLAWKANRYEAICIHHYVESTRDLDPATHRMPDCLVRAHEENKRKYRETLVKVRLAITRQRKMEHLFASKVERLESTIGACYETLEQLMSDLHY